MVDRVLSLVVALSMAVLVWLYARSRDQEILDHVPVPVHVVMIDHQDDEYTLEVTGTPQVVANFSGPPARIRELRALLQRDELHVHLSFVVPAERLKESRLAEVLTVEAANIPTPPGITTTMVSGRNQLRLVLHRMVEKQLPVRFDQSLESHPIPVVIEPETVRVRGPQEVLDRVTSLSTQPWLLPHRPGKSIRSSARVPLVPLLEGREITCEPAFVSVRTIAQEPKTHTLTDLPVHFLLPSGYVLRPRFDDDRAGKITIRVTGPGQEEPPRVHAFVDLTRVPPTAGLYAEPIQLQLPKDFQLIEETSPRTVAFRLLAPDVPSAPLGRPRGETTGDGVRE